ncbi:MAG: TolC family outer membrane protein [Thiobacillaceae bacterium]
MHTLATKILATALAAALSPMAFSANLSDIYHDALVYDAQYASARAAYQAGTEKLPQARAGLLPNVSLTGNLNRNDVNSTLPGGDSRFTSNGLAASATQPLFRMQNWVQFEQAQLQMNVFENQLKVAEQDLILRTARTYFDVLQAQNNIAFIQSQKAAIAEQLASSKRNFEVGTATVTDTHEAQARYDLATAQEIAAINDREVKLRSLQRLIGKPPAALAVLAEQAAMKLPEPRSIDDWVSRAAENNLQAGIQRNLKLIADQEVEKNRAGHYPTLDAVANYNISNNQNFGSIKVDTRTAVIGLQLAVPIFQGGLVSSKVREAVANQDKARFDLDNAQREASLQASQAYLNVTNGEAQVKALEQARTSTQAQLDSTKLGLQVGVRTSLDVLNAQQQVLSAQRDLAAARYNFLLSGLNLKAAAGALNAADLAEIDGYLTAAQ